jgi:hypothetical protein
MIKKVNGKWYLYSKDGSKKLSKGYLRKDDPELKKREEQVLYFKRKK